MYKYVSVPGKFKYFFPSRKPPGLQWDPTKVLFQTYWIRFPWV